MQGEYRTATFRIKKEGCSTFIVERLRCILWFIPLYWKPERYWRHKNDSPGSYVNYTFDSYQKALDYINKTDYTTKVLWTDV